MRKLMISMRYLITFLIILTISNAAFSQSEKYSVPVKWELYSALDKKVSFLMPRLPILAEESNSCLSIETQTFAAYHSGVVYLLKVISQIRKKAYCREIREFDESRFTERVQSVSAEKKNSGEYENNLAGKEIIKFAGSNEVLKLINDFENKRWFEISVYGADEKKTEVKNFLASLKAEKSTSGIAVNQGAEQVFGDEASIIEDKITDNTGKVETVKRMLVKTESPENKGITIILKPRANYTEAARKDRIQGKVVLRVSFLANGAVGAVSEVSGLPNGLTEEAIKVARKIVFIPPQRDGARYSVTKPVEYNFYIY